MGFPSLNDVADRRCSLVSSPGALCVLRAWSGSAPGASALDPGAP
eukprot:CAMPEP_0173272226 /NCGR_PEP_ID=MMETSP1143-20121109/1244_1 /TAXON_ID=483371 /ORGANISM="non described non described, Strain CCMP2298" /LENGTH=44 /DNA_ID= /DNA_START= /DNA_END= /DNA_ORIENTATION=